MKRGKPPSDRGRRTIICPRISPSPRPSSRTPHSGDPGPGNLHEPQQPRRLADRAQAPPTGMPRGAIPRIPANLSNTCAAARILPPCSKHFDRLIGTPGSTGCASYGWPGWRSSLRCLRSSPRPGRRRPSSLSPALCSRSAMRARHSRLRLQPRRLTPNTPAQAARLSSSATRNRACSTGSISSLRIRRGNSCRSCSERCGG